MRKGFQWVEREAMTTARRREVMGWDSTHCSLGDFETTCKY